MGKKLWIGIVVVVVLAFLVLSGGDGGDTVPEEEIQEIDVNVYTASEDNTVHKLDMNGSQIWTYDEHEDAVLGVEVGSDGYIYTAGIDGSHRVAQNGSQIWARNIGDWLRDVAVDEAGNVYTSNGGVHKTTTGNEELWTYEEHFEVVHGLAVGDQDEYIYTASGDPAVHKISSDGEQQWQYTEHTGAVYDVAVDDTGAVYTAAADGVHKVSSEGEQLWTYEGHGGPNLEGVTVRDGLVYTVGDSGELHVLDAESGDRIWDYSQNVMINDVAVDSAGFVYTAGDNGQVHKIDPNGEQVWTYTQHRGHVRGIAVEPAA